MLYTPEPFDTAEATYVWTGVHTPGFYRITVTGHSRKFSSGFKIVRDSRCVGGLAFDVVGWTSPLAEPPSVVPYTVTDVHGAFHSELVVIGSNKRDVVKVNPVHFRGRDSQGAARGLTGTPPRLGSSASPNGRRTLREG